METFAGLGYTAGPVIGAVLYEYGGFQLPFFALGGLLVLASVSVLLPAAFSSAIFSFVVLLGRRNGG